MKKIMLLIAMLFIYSPLFSAVEFMGLSAEVEDMNVVLTWSTASETENVGFILERKSDSLANWGALVTYLQDSTLRGQGTVSYQTDYLYTDTTVNTGTYYYRISGVDEASALGLLDSLSVTVTETGVKEIIPDEFLLICYPNPFNPSITLSSEHINGCSTMINIYNTRGELVKNVINGFVEAGHYEVVWDARTMPSGIYIVKMVAGDNIHTQKIILQK